MEHKEFLHKVKLDSRFSTQLHEARESVKEYKYITCTGSNADKAKRKSCGKQIRLDRAFKCLYCNFWFCETCMEKHLGKTKKQYQIDKLKRVENESK